MGPEPVPGSYGPPPWGGAVIRFGDVDVSTAVRNANVSSHIGDMARAVLHLRRSAPDLTRVDFTAEVVIGRGHDDSDRLFTGLVVSAAPEEEDLRVECVSNPALLESSTGALQVRMPPVDTIYAILRTAGMPPERMQLHGIEDLPTELYEVAVPVHGLTATDPVRIGPVSLSTDRSASATVAVLDDSDVVRQFTDSAAHAVTYVLATRTFDAVTAGIRKIDAALAFINVRLRFANAIDPTGAAPGWSRQQLNQVVSRGNLIAARGQMTGRTWLQEIGDAETSVLEQLVASPAANATLTARRPALRDAYGAAARAVVADDPVTKITAINEALEFYAARADLNYGFTKQERKALRNAAEGFSARKRKRIENLLGIMNQVPLMARLRHQFAVDGVPMTPSDMETLARVRKHRNDLVHGLSGEVDDADIERAVSIVARILTYGSHAITRPETTDPAAAVDPAPPTA